MIESVRMWVDTYPLSLVSLLVSVIGCTVGIGAHRGWFRSCPARERVIRYGELLREAGAATAHAGYPDVLAHRSDNPTCQQCNELVTDGYTQASDSVHLT